MNFLFDVETTGLPLDRKASPKDVGLWPRIVQIAWNVIEDDCVIDEKSYIIKPDGYTIPKAASDIHRITTERALDEGIDISYVLEEVIAWLEVGPILVAHNFEFDSKVLASEMHRLQLFPRLSQPLRKICTMLETMDLCQLPGKFGSYKWPRLSELYHELFNEELVDAHDALVDVKALSRCYLELLDRKIIR